MTQRYWVPYTPDSWSTFDTEEWDTLLLEPAGISGAGTLVGDPATIAGQGSPTRVGQGNLAAVGGQIAGVGDVHPVNKSGSGSLVAGQGAMLGTGRRDPSGAGTLAAGPATMAGAGQRGVSGSGNLAALPASTHTAFQTISGDGTLVAGAAALAGDGAAITDITGSGALVAGEASVFAAGDRDLIANPSIIERLYAVESAHETTRDGVDVTAIMQNSLAAGHIHAVVNVRQCRREQGEIELFYDDEERPLVLGGGFGRG